MEAKEDGNKEEWEETEHPNVDIQKIRGETCQNQNA